MEPLTSIPSWARSSSSTLLKHAVSIRSSEVMTTFPYVTGSQAIISGMAATATMTRQHFTAPYARAPPSLLESKRNDLLQLQWGRGIVAVIKMILTVPQHVSICHEFCFLLQIVIPEWLVQGRVTVVAQRNDATKEHATWSAAL